MKKGLQEGIVKEQQKEKLSVANQLLKKGFSPVDVAEITGLSLESVQFIVK